MSDTVAAVRYDSSIEQIEPHDEQQAVTQLNQIIRSILDTTSQNYGHAVRGVHAKGHGVVTGTFVVKDGLPADYAQGLFAAPGEYDAVLRFSTAPGDILDDAVSSPRGIGLKVLGVPGERLADAVDGDQDFLMVNGPVFGAPTPAAFAKNLKLLAATTDKAEGLKKVLSATLQTIEAGLEAVGGQSVLISQLGGTPETHPLGQDYFSQTAFRYGDHIAKFALRPVSPGLTQWKDEKVDLAGRPDALREDVGRGMIEHGGEWDFCVQLCTDLKAMPVENPTVLWDEKQSPFVAVATLRIAPQPSWQLGVTEKAEDLLTFSPWHGLLAHQPLGAINRARKPVYDAAQHFRSEFNGCPMHQVKQLADLVD